MNALAHTELTTRQHEVLARLVRGLGNRAIARELGVSEADVKAIVARMLRKLAVPTRAALAAKAAMIDLTGVDPVFPGIHRQLLREAPMLMCVLTGPDHRFALANDAFARRSPTPLLGRRLSDVFPDSELPSIADRVYAAGTTVTLRDYLAEWRGTDGAQREAMLDLVIHPLHDESSNIVALASFAIETGSHVTTTALSDAQRALLRAIPAGVIVVDRSCRILFANPAALRAIQWRSAPVTLDELAARITLRDPSAARTLPFEEWPGRQALRGSEVPPRVYEVMGDGGQVQRYLIGAAPLRTADGTISGATIVVSALGEA